MRIISLILVLCLVAPIALCEGVSAPRSAITLDITMNENTHSLEVVQRMRVFNPTDGPLSAMYFYMYPNAYRRYDTLPLPTEYRENIFKDGWAPAGIDIQAVAASGAAANWGVSTDSESILRVNCDVAKGAYAEIELAYRLILPPGLGVLGANENIWRLCHFQPLPAVYEDDMWRLDTPNKIGDALGLLPVTDFYATVTLPKSWEIVSGGSVALEKTENNRLIYTVNAPKMRECPIAFVRGYSTLESSVNGTLIRSVFRTNAGGKRALDSAVRALTLFNDWFGEYPYPVFTVVESPFFAGGMEMPGLIYVSDALYSGGAADRQDFTVAHETAHQWWYSLVASDSNLAPWLDEALTQYCTYLYVENTRGKDAFLKMLRDEVAPAVEYTQPGGLTVDAESSRFYTMSEYVNVVYLRGAAVFHELRLALGLTGFLAGLKLYAQRKAFDIATYSDLFSAMHDATGQDVTAFMLDYIAHIDEITPDYSYE